MIGLENRVRTIRGTHFDLRLPRVHVDEPAEDPLKGASNALGAVCYSPCSLAVGVRGVPRRGRIDSSSVGHRSHRVDHPTRQRSPRALRVTCKQFGVESYAFHFVSIANPPHLHRR